MSADYKVIFFGTDAEDDRKIEVMRGVQELLKLSEQHLVSLFDSPQGVTLYHTDDRKKAERLVRRLERVGARAELIDKRAPQNKSADDWEPEEKAEITHQVFQCRACNYAERLPPTEPIPAICPECGVVATKYEHVANEKRKRERIRRSVVDIETARQEKTETAAQRIDEDALRRQIEREVRRELGIASPAAQRVRGGMIAAGVFAVGVLSSMAIDRIWSSPESTRQTVQTSKPATTLGVAESAKTIIHANTVAGVLTGIDWQQVREPPIGNGIASADPEPWLTAPPTAAGGQAESATTPANSGSAPATSPAMKASDPTINDDAMRAIVAAWQSNGVIDPLELLRMQRLATDLIRAGHADQALSTTAWVEDPEQRFRLLTTITEQAVLGADDTLIHRVRERLNEMSDGNGNPSDAVLALLALENLRERPFDATAQTNVEARLLRLINGSQLAPSDAIVLHALVAAQYSRVDAAERWFAEANHAFQRIADPVDQLNALARLTRAYHAAGDRHTADRLVHRVRAGSDALGKAIPGRLQVIDQLVQTYRALGQIDRASQLIEQTASSPFDADLQRARLATALSADNQVTAARGLVTTIVHPVGRARANTRLSAIAALRKQFVDAQLLADAAVSDIRRLPPAVQSLLTSDLIQALPDDVARAHAAAAVTGSGPQADRRLAIVATNLAWNRVGTSARELSQGIDDETLRIQTQQRIDELGTLFGAAATVNLAGTLY
jgi:hypothetical protein